MGDFDEDAAEALLEMLKNSSYETARVTVSTNCVNRVDPFGAARLAKGISKHGGASRLLFVGENADKIAPKGTLLYV